MEKALIYATNAYEGKDRGKLLKGIELMLLMRSEREQEVAILKDILSVKTIEEIKGEGFSDELIEALEAITKRPRENMGKFMERVSLNETASMVMYGALLIELYSNESLPKKTAAITKDIEKAKTFLSFLSNIVREKQGGEAE